MLEALRRLRVAGLVGKVNWWQWKITAKGRRYRLRSTAGRDGRREATLYTARRSIFESGNYDSHENEAKKKSEQPVPRNRGEPSVGVEHPRGDQNQRVHHAV